MERVTGMLPQFMNINEHILREEQFNIYGGSGKKRTVIMDDGKRYILKVPTPRRNRGVLYISNPVSEYVGCHVYQLVGIPAQRTYLGTYITEEGKEKIACLCEDFSNDGLVLHEADKLELGVLESNTLFSLKSVKALIGQVRGIDHDKICAEYCNRIIVDGLIGVTDRYNENWGFTENTEGYVDIAPVYDCGASYSPILDDSEVTNAGTRMEAENTMTAFQYPDGRRVKYIDLIYSDDKDIQDAICRVVPNIPLEEIIRMIEDIPYISNTRKEYCKKITEYRYHGILVPAMERIFRMNRD